MEVLVYEDFCLVNKFIVKPILRMQSQYNFNNFKHVNTNNTTSKLTTTTYISLGLHIFLACI